MPDQQLVVGPWGTITDGLQGVHLLEGRDIALIALTPKHRTVACPGVRTVAFSQAIANDWQHEEIRCIAMNVPWQCSCK